MNRCHDRDQDHRQLRIWVDGRLEHRFSDGLDGVDQHDTEEGTLLTAAFIDRAQLHGILEHLMGLAIDVRRFEVDPPVVSNGHHDD